MTLAHSRGKSERILGFSSDKKVTIDEEVLKKTFEHPDVKDRKIVAFSVIGSYRKGKSFFLDYCLRFMYANYQSINSPNNSDLDPEHWMGDEDEPLSGFSWRCGADRDTMGIVIWNDVFLHTDENTGEKIAIIVIDTQGLFDSETTAINNSRIFALGTLISSIQVLNLSNVIQEDQLQYLQFATEFAKFAFKDSQKRTEKCFQNLMFLIRDWQNPDDHPFTLAGGKSYLDKILQVKDTQKDELRSVRKFIHSSFEKLDCFLLPNPGKIVTGVKKIKNTQYNGNWKDMDDDFRIEFFKLIKYLLSPKRLILKKINDIELDGSTYLNHLLQYFKLFQSDKLPRTQTIYESTVEKHLEMIVSSCIEKYNIALKNRDGSVEKIEDILLIHDLCKNEALLLYKDAKKMGNAEHEEKFRKILEDQMNKIYLEWKEQTEANIRKVEDEKKKTRIAEEEKQKLAKDKLKLEQEASELKFKFEKLKQDFEMEKLVLSKDKEIEQIKFKAENERQADERRYDMEKFKLEKEIDLIKISNESEVEKSAMEMEHNMKISEHTLLVEKAKAEAERLKMEHEIQVQLNEMESSLQHEKLISQMKIAETSSKSEKEQSAMKIDMAFEKMRLERENDQQKHLKEQEVMKAEQKVEEQRLQNLLLQQRNDDMAKRVQSVEEDLSSLRDRDDTIVNKVLDIVSTGVELFIGGKKAIKKK